MQSYCKEFCKFDGICDKKYIPKLATSVRACEMVVIKDDMKKGDYNDLPHKTTQLKYLALKTQSDIRIQKAEDAKIGV